MIRRLSILLACAAVVAAAWPSSASAGEYMVRACHQDGVNNSWHSYRTDGFAAAYAECPAEVTSGGHTNVGMLAHNTVGPGSAPYFSHARMYFDAPSGTRISHVLGDMNHNSSGGGWLAGLYDETGNRWMSCTFCGTGGKWLHFSTGFSTQRVSALAMCAASGCARNAMYAYVALRNVYVVLAEDSLPNVGIPSTGLAAPGWRGGVQDLTISANDPVGIRRTVVSIDDQDAHSGTRPCDDTQTVPCPNGTTTARIDTRPFADGNHALEVVTLDAAENSRVIRRTISIDNHAPGPPLELSVDDGTGWRSGDKFVLRWRVPQERFAPIARAHVQLCEVGTSLCLSPRSVGRVTSAAVAAPRAGEWRAQVWLEDAAGNARPHNAAERILRFDNTPPSVALHRPTADRPALVRVTAKDEGGGLGSREIFVRRRGTSSWLSLPVSIQANGFSTSVDDERLRDGVYELRARAVDVAGNERTTDRFSAGTPAQLALPLRIKTRLRVGRPKRVRARGAGGKRRYRVKLVRAPRAGYGRTIPLRGRLTSPGGNPLAGRDVQVFEQTRLPASRWRPIATLRTNRSGRFTFRALRGPSRTLRFRFGGSDTIRGRNADVRLGVRAATSMRVSRDQVVNGEEVTFRGRLRGRPLPATGKLVELQAYARGRWFTFATTRAHLRTGRWSHRYRFSATRGSIRYRFRAAIPKEAGYPYEPGTSRQVKVGVRGL